jgi:hypothetical protein
VAHLLDGTGPLGGLTALLNQILAIWVAVKWGLLPVSAAGTTCTILHLTLGALDLNLLGLTVHLDPVLLDISAVQAPGNLLGNLLCAVAHLLDGTGPLGGLTALLNQILAILQGIGL